MPSLETRRPDLVEWMDRDDCDAHRLQATYGHFRWINRHLGRWRTLYRRLVRPVLREVAGPSRGLEGCERGAPIRVLDVGCGGGDVAQAIFRWGQADGMRVEVTGIDPDARALAHARMGRMDEPGPVPEFRQATSHDLVDAGESFHVVLSNHVLHHLPPDEVSPFLSSLESLATHRVVVADIERSRLAYALFGLISRRPAFSDSYIRVDGLLSIRRSFTRRELQALVPSGWEVKRLFPFRLVALRELPNSPGPNST